MRIIKIFSFLHLLISVGLLHGNSISIKQDSKNYEEMISFYLEILNGNFSSEYINGEDTLVISKEKPSWLNNKIKFKHLFLANYFSDLNDTNIYKEYFPQYFRDLVNERAIHSPRGATILDYYNSHYILSDSIRDVIDYEFQLKIDSLSNDTSNLYLIKFIELIIPSTRPSSSGYISRSKLIRRYLKTHPSSPFYGLVLYNLSNEKIFTYTGWQMTINPGIANYNFDQKTYPTSFVFGGKIGLMFKKYVVSVGLLGSTIENEKVLYISNDSIPRNTEIGFLFFPFSIGYIVQMSESFVVTPALGINLNDSYLMKDEEKRLNISPDFNDTKGTHIEIAFDYYWERWYRKNGFLNGSAICTGFEIGYSINDISKIRNDFGNGFFYMNLRFPIIASHAKRDFAFLENLR